jgi:transcription antitermination factor NusG
MESGKQWYAVQVGARKEKLVASVVAEKGYECFLPLHTVRKAWSDRIKVTSVPLFGGYVFCRFDATQRLPILVTPGVHSIVGTGNVPAAIPQKQLDSIRIAVQSGLTLEPSAKLEEGDRVVVTKGPLTGVEGIFVKHRNRNRLILSVSLIHRSVAVEIDSLYVEPIPRSLP